jgi:hypothetical protein
MFMKGMIATMHKKASLLIMAIGLLLAACSTRSPQGSESSGEALATASGESSPTPTEAPTATPTAPATPTETPTPTATPDPLLQLIGRWSCPGCYRQQLIKFSLADSGVQYTIMRADGSEIEWIGPDRCANINIGYSDCIVSANPSGTVLVSFVQPTGGGCTQRFEQDFAYAEGILSRVRYESWNYCGGEVTLHQDLLTAVGPWGDYTKVE